MHFGGETMKSRKIAIPATIAIWCAVVVVARVARAADATAAPSQHIAVSLSAGETYVINDLRPDATPAVKVIDNPHALVVHAEVPGKLVLLGAETGRWEVSVSRADGQNVTYEVAVSKQAPPLGSLAPGSSPPPIVDSGVSAAIAAPPVVAPETAPRSVPAAAASAGAAAPSAGASSASASSGPETELLALSVSSAPTRPAAPSASALAAPAAPSQAVGEIQPPGGYRQNPSVLNSNGAYYSPSASGGANYLSADVVQLMTGSSEIIDFQRRLTRVSVADSKVADIQVISPYQINVIGHQAGFTTLAVWDDQGHYEERQVRIDPSGRQQVMLNCIVAELDRSRIENQGIDLALAFPTLNLSLVSLPGNVATPYSATSPTASGGSTNSGLLPGGALTPLLLSQNLTYGIAAQNSVITTQSFLHYLEQHQLGRILAEPHLLANSGEKARFLSGGEIPIVIAQALNTSIVFKQFGTSVEFVPTVVGRDQIELLVKPEVSQPDYAHGVQLFGFNVPAFVTRRAETLVRLKDDQTLIIAGLILHNRVSQVNKVPYLGDVPYLGAIFRNTYWQDQETDLVMSVTPQIVAPLPQGAEVSEPSRRGPLSPGEVRTRRIVPYDASRPRF
jgi:Flp pilus assembly secretin CpaC